MTSLVPLSIKHSASLAGIAFGGVDQVLLVDNPDAFNVVVPHGETVFPIDFNIPLTGLQLLMIDASQDCTLKTNHTGDSADDTIPVKKGALLFWTKNMPDSTKLIGTAVTKIYVAVPGTVDCILKVGYGAIITE